MLNRVLFSSLRRISHLKTLQVSAILLYILLIVCSAKAQTFSFSLDNMPEFVEETPWDSLSVGDITNLSLGLWYKVPNFLESDFSRTRIHMEFSLGRDIRITFSYPRIYRFEFTEEKQGVFYVIHPRDLLLPGLKIKFDTLDDIIEESKEKSFREEWTKGVRLLLSRIKKAKQDKKGMIHVTVPIPLPKTVERVIGKGEETNIDISGRESITFSGESRRVNPFIGVEGQQKQPLFPTLDMKQELDVRLQGTIGQKINVQVDHTSNPLSENQNRIRLNYKGFEDDIVKLIEMGNTNLSLPGSQLVSFSTASKGLFGIKALAQAGPVDITMIASKEEGEASSASFAPRGGAFGKVESKIIRDIDYVKNRYFFLDSPDVGIFSPQEGALEIFVSVYPWERTANPDMVTFYGRAWVDRGGHGDDIKDALQMIQQGQSPPSSQVGDFELLTLGEDYSFVLNAEDESILGIELFREISNDKILAVRYENELGDTIGNYGDFADTLALELIKPTNPLPTDEYGYTWHYMMRHIYNLRLSNIDASSLELEIEDNSNRLDKTTPEESSIPYLRIFGLDRTDESGVGPPDNRVDLTTGLIDLQRGILIFPTTRPFDPPKELVAEWTDSMFSFTGEDSELTVPEIYDDFLTIPEDVHTFNIVIKASSVTKTFFIDAFNIIEGSEVVTLDNRKLARNRDYTIDYETGEVELKGEVLNELTPESRINIDYEFKPFAGGASSSLLGFNSLVHLSKSSRIGTTWLYESKTSGVLKPRLGEESTRSLVGDVDGYLQFNSDLLTSFVNKLPLVETETKSTVTVSGEVAMSIPNPNTSGEAYIDDLEGAEDSDNFSMSRRSWVMASPPMDPDSSAFIALNPGDREKFFWYNIEPEQGVHRLDWNPNLDVRENSLIQSLDIEFDSTMASVDPSHWAGVMTGFAGGGLNLSRGQFIELWVNDFKPDSTTRDGYIYIEMGNIDEDYFEPENDEHNTEDKNRDGFNALTEDTGLDGIYENQGDVDTAGDDYDPNRIGGRFAKINGTEHNGYLDDEDLDRSGQLDKNNSYFRFTLNLRDSAIIDVQRDFPGNVPNPEDAWRMYRINLNAATIVYPSGIKPRWEQIKHMRIWFKEISSLVNSGKNRIQMAGFKVVGNRWEEDGVRDLEDKLLNALEKGSTDFKLGVISTKTDPITYVPPFDPGERDNIAQKEQSLFVKFEDLDPQKSLRIRKRFPGRGMDFTSYRDLNFFVHTDIKNDSLEYFFRIAFDSLNYYEVRFPLEDSYLSSVGWALVSVSLTDLTSLKFLQPDTTQKYKKSITDLADPSKSYTAVMIGNPSLFSVRFLYAGLKNTSTDEVLSGEIWIDDIYLGSVKRDTDFAARFSTSVGLANVLYFNVGWQKTGPDYHGLRQKRGSGSTTSALNFSGKSRLEYFIPLFGFTIPLSGSYSKRTSFPKFNPNSDTEISDKAMQDSLRTESIVRGFSTTISKRKSKNPFFKYTFDRMKTNFSMSQSARISPSSADTTTTMSGTFDYQMSWGRNRKARIFKNYTLRYWLNSISFRVQASRKKGKRYRLTGGRLVADPPMYSAGLQSSGSATYVPFPSLKTSFRMSLKRDVKLPHKWLGVNIGREINRSQSTQATYKPPPLWLLKAFSPDFSYSSSYREDSSPNVRRAGDPKGVRNVSSSRTLNAKMRFDIGGMFKKIFVRVHLLDKKKTSKSKPRSRARKGGADLRRRVGESPSETPPKESKTDTTKVTKKADPLIAVKRLGRLLSRIRKVNASIQQRVSSSYSRVADRPSLKYQLGFTKDSGVSTKGIRNDQPDRYTRNLNISFDSGTQITENIDVAGRYTTSILSNVFRQNDTGSRNTTWPDLSFNWKGLERIRGFNKLLVSSNLTLGYKRSSQQIRRQGKIQSESSTLHISPAIAAKWKNGMNTTLSGSRNKKINESHGSKIEQTSYLVALDLKYSFAGGKGFRIPLPFFSKRIKFKSRLNTSVNVSYLRSGGKRISLMTQEPEKLPGTNSLKVSPRLTYNFSRTLNGSLFINYFRTYSEASNQTVSVIRVGINTIFTF